MSRRKGIRPSQYASAFQYFDEIPSRYRLDTYANEYSGEDTWGHYCQEVLFPKYSSDRLKESAERGGNSWLEHMEDRGQHHALATPEDANEWCKDLLSPAGHRSLETCYEYYYNRIYQFYDYLKFSYRHPHLYNPLLLAAVKHSAPRKIWMVRINRRPEVVDRE